MAVLSKKKKKKKKTKKKQKTKKKKISSREGKPGYARRFPCAKEGGGGGGGGLEPSYHCTKGEDVISSFHAPAKQRFACPYQEEEGNVIQPSRGPPSSFFEEDGYNRLTGGRKKGEGGASHSKCVRKVGKGAAGPFLWPGEKKGKPIRKSDDLFGGREGRGKGEGVFTFRTKRSRYNLLKKKGEPCASWVKGGGESLFSSARTGRGEQQNSNNHPLGEMVPA